MEQVTTLRAIVVLQYVTAADPRAEDGLGNEVDLLLVLLLGGVILQARHRQGRTGIETNVPRVGLSGRKKQRRGPPGVFNRGELAHEALHLSPAVQFTQRDAEGGEERVGTGRQRRRLHPHPAHAKVEGSTRS